MSDGLIAVIFSVVKLPIFLSLFLLCCICSVRANDGFYQGSGTTLIPINVSGVRVVSEKLTISALDTPNCYSVYLRGRLFDDNFPTKLVKDGVDIGELQLTKNRCIPYQTLRTWWRAVVHYEIFAESNVSQAQLAFPVPTWALQYDGEDGLYEMAVPSATQFQMKINGKSEPTLGVKRIAGLKSVNDEVNDVLAFRWQTSFEKDTKYIIETQYEFGVDYSNSMYYNNGDKIWYRERCKDSVHHDFNASQNDRDCPEPGARTLEYFMTPLATWGHSPPDSIDIAVHLHKNMRPELMNFRESKPSCLDSGAVYFAIRKRFPQHELVVSYPPLAELVSQKKITKNGSIGFSSISEWTTFLNMIGSEAQLTCKLRDSLAANAMTQTAHDKIKSHTCVPICPAN